MHAGNCKNVRLPPALPCTPSRGTNHMIDAKLPELSAGDGRCSKAFSAVRSATTTTSAVMAPQQTGRRRQRQSHLWAIPFPPGYICSAAFVEVSPPLRISSRRTCCIPKLHPRCRPRHRHLQCSSQAANLCRGYRVRVLRVDCRVGTGASVVLVFRLVIVPGCPLMRAHCQIL